MNDFQASFGELKQFGSPNILYLVVINWRAEDFWLVINVLILNLAQKMEVAVSNLFCGGGFFSFFGCCSTTQRRPWHAKCHTFANKRVVYVVTKSVTVPSFLRKRPFCWVQLQFVLGFFVQ